MTEEAKEARRAYLREWARRNREKCREYQKRHWEKVAAAQLKKEGQRSEEE